MHHTGAHHNLKPSKALSLHLKRAFAFGVICAEQMTTALWRVFFWSLFFFGLWMLQVPSLFDKAGLYLALFVYISGLIWFFYRDFRGLRFPNRKQIDRRIERESGILHRPLSETEDSPIHSENPETLALWEAEQKRRARSLENIKLVRWGVFLAGRDRYGLRLMAVIIFAAGYMVAGYQWQSRILEGLIPVDWYDKRSNLPPVIVTITPPEYTGLAQNVLRGIGDIREKQSIPTGSDVHILMHSALTNPYITFQGEKARLERIDERGFEYRFTLEVDESKPQDEPQQSRLDLKQLFISHFSFAYEIVPDLPPQITMQEITGQEKEDLLKQKQSLAEVERLLEAHDAEDSDHAEDSEKPHENSHEHPHDHGDHENDKAQTLTELPDSVDSETLPLIDLEAPLYREPKTLTDAQLQIPLTLYDDYGVKTLHITMDIAPTLEDKPIGEPVEIIRSVMSAAAQSTNIAPVLDFTDHSWAGLPVTISITAIDHIGQETALTPLELVLPEREFKHPVARQLVSLRKQLAWEPIHAAASVHADLERLLDFPQDFEDNMTAFLAIRVAASRLYYAVPRQLSPDYKETRSVMALLWDTALLIEGGNLSIAARNLRFAQMRLENALQNQDIPDEQITALMNELRQAMDNYITEYSKELQKRFAEGEELLLTPEILRDLLNPEELADFFTQMENEMRDGNNDLAQGMLSKLQTMLDLLNPDMALPIPEDMLFMADSVSELQQLIDMQTALLTQTEEQAETLKRFQNKDFGNLIPPDLELFMHWRLDNLPPPPSRERGSAQRFSGVLTEQNRTEQESMRYILGQLMLETDRMLGKIPEKMGLAEREMLYSSDQLEKNRPDESVPHQKLAIEYLTQAQQEMQQELQQRLQQMAGGDMMSGQQQERFGGFGQRFGQAPGQYDPLGRPLQGGRSGGRGTTPYPDSDVTIPDEAQRKRVEEILRILRERSGDLSRSREELEYFRRLLRQF